MKTIYTVHNSLNEIEINGSMADVRAAFAISANPPTGSYYVHNGEGVIGAFRVTKTRVEEIDRSSFLDLDDAAKTARTAADITNTYV